MNKTDEIYKMSLFEQAEIAHIEATEHYELASDLRADGNEKWLEIDSVAEEFEAKFESLFEKISALGWDAEYMGIA